jgi:putative mRNA 3-end processing factor
MFRHEGTLELHPLGLQLDGSRSHRRGFVSHAHADHFARHGQIVCTPATAAMLAHRFRATGLQPQPYEQPLVIDHWSLTLLPAGHMFGSAMLLAEVDDQRLLYTGDFRLKPSLTAEAARPRPADILIMECTFGEPRYRFPPRAHVVEQLSESIRRAHRHGCTPVLSTYAVGKAQELTRQLTAEGFRVLHHPLIYQASQLYEQLGCALGDFELYGSASLDQGVLLWPRRAPRSAHYPLPRRRHVIALTGWAVGRSPHALQADEAFPYSDHADFAELLECVAQVAPHTVYCHHGTPLFVETLRAHGWRAEWLSS